MRIKNYVLNHWIRYCDKKTLGDTILHYLATKGAYITDDERTIMIDHAVIDRYKLGLRVHDSTHVILQDIERLLADPNTDHRHLKWYLYAKAMRRFGPGVQAFLQHARVRGHKSVKVKNLMQELRSHVVACIGYDLTA